MGGQGAIRAYVNSKVGVKIGIEWEARQTGKKQGAQRADGSRRKEHKMSGRRPGAQRAMMAMGQSNTQEDRASYQWLDQWARKAGVIPGEEMDWLLARNLTLSRCTRLERKTKEWRNGHLWTASTDGGQSKQKWALYQGKSSGEKSASSPDISLRKISGLKNHEMMMVSSLFSGGTTKLLPLQAVNWFCFSRPWKDLNHPPDTIWHSVDTKQCWCSRSCCNGTPLNQPTSSPESRSLQHIGSWRW